MSSNMNNIRQEAHIDIQTLGVQKPPAETVPAPASPLQKLSSKVRVGAEQASKPFSNPETAKFVQKGFGISLIAIGGLGFAVLSPVVLPLALLGGGLGLIGGRFIAEAYKKHQSISPNFNSDKVAETKKEIIGAGAAGGAILGSFLTLGIMGIGFKIMMEGFKKTPENTKTEDIQKPQVEVKPQVGKEKEIEKLTNSIQTLQNMCDTKRATIEKGQF